MVNGSCVLGSGDGSNLGDGGGSCGSGGQAGGAVGGTTEGNPIHAATGNKYQRESDYAGQGMVPLDFWRSYNSYSGSLPGVLGANWRTNFDAELQIQPYGNFGNYQLSEVRITAIRPDGQELSFNGSVSASTSWALPEGSLLSPAQPIQVRLQKTASGYRYIREDDLLEDYSAEGRLLSIQDRRGQQLTLSYGGPDGAQLLAVTDSFGRQLGFAYNSQGLLSGMTDPDGGISSYAYNASGRLSSVSYPDGTTRAYHYENTSFPQLLTGVTDQRGIRTATYAYDTQGRATSSTHAGGAGQVTLSYNSNGTTTVVDALGTSRTRAFSNLQGLYKPKSTSTGCTACGGDAQSLTYDAAGNVATRTDFNGVVTAYLYDSIGRETQRIEAQGTGQERIVSTQWHATLRKPIQIDEPGRREELTHDASGNLLTRTLSDTSSGASRTWSFSHDSYGRVVTIDGPRTDVSDLTHYAYHPVVPGAPESGQLQSITNAKGHVTQFTEYDASGRLRTMIDPNGVITSLTYSERGLLTAVNHGGATTGYSYDAAGNPDRVTLPTGSYLDYDYDPAGRLTDIRDGAGNHIHYTLDGLGNRTAEQIRDPGLVLRRSQTQVFDSLGRLKEVHGANQQVWRYDYDAQGNRTAETQAGQYSTLSEFDALNRLVAQSDVAGRETRLGYNPLDQLTAVTDALGRVTSYSFNALGDLLSQTSPDSGTTSYLYDAAGNRTRQTDARGVVVNYNYDVLNRLSLKAYPADSTLDTVFNYDGSNFPAPEGNALGRLTGITRNSTEKTRYHYNPRGTVNRQFNATAGVQLLTKYSYDTADRLTSVTYPSGRVVHYDRDGQGQVHRLRTQSSTLLPNETLADGIERLPWGPIRTMNRSNGVTRSDLHDLDYRLQTRQDGSLLYRSYTYDPRDAITGISDLLDPSRSQSFGYDDLQRLTSASGDYGQLSYSYDAVGNRLQEIRNGVADIYGYAPSSQRLLSIQGQRQLSFGYDAAGNQTQSTGRSYEYDAGGRLRTVRVGGSPVLEGQTYTGQGQRLRHTEGSTSRRYIYDLQGQLLAEASLSGTARAEYVWLDGQPLAVIRPRIGGSQAEVFHYHNDHLGTPQKLSDMQGTLVWDARYEPFGSAVLLTEQVSNHLRLPGQYFDATTGLHQNWHRDYDPSLGRYLQSDPIGLVGGLNTYAYVGGNPVSYVDSTGLNPVAGATAGGTIGGPVGAVVGGALGLGAIYLGQYLGEQAATAMYNRPPGAWPGDVGAEEWGRRNDLGAKEGRRRFHDIKRGNRGKPGSRAPDSCSVDPSSGDVYDGLGDYIGNLDNDR